MAFTQADLDTVNAAIAKGELEVEFADRRVRYRSIDQLLAARSAIISGLQQASSTTRPKQLLGVSSKGF